MDDIEFNYKRSNILFLKNVFLANLATPEEQFETRLLDEVTPAQTRHQHAVIETPKYVALPERFNGLDNWPKSSNLLCWYCRLSHNNRPVFIPLGVTPDTTGNIHMDTHGHFCSFSCAKRYIDINFGFDPTWDDKIRHLNILHKIFTGNKIKFIVPAIEYTKMKPYCGDTGFTEREYKEKNVESNKIYSESEYKLEHIKT